MREPPPSKPHASRDAFAAVLYGLALVLGLLRFVRLGHWGLWFDEVLTWGDSHSGLRGVVNDAGYLFVRTTVERLGGVPTEAHLRFLPAVAGYAAIPLAHWAFRPFAGRRRAALAALVVAVSAWQLQWSQTARFYSLVQAIGLLGAGIAVRGQMAASLWRTAVGIAVAGSGLAFHLCGGILAAALTAGLVIVPPSDTRAAKRAIRGAVALFLVPAVFVVPSVHGAWSRYAGNKAVDDPLGGVAHLALSTGSFVTPALAALALASAILALGQRDRRALFALAVPLFGGSALAGAAALATASAQYAFPLFPWIALVAVWPIGFPELARRRFAPLAFVLVAALPQLAESALYMTVQHGQRPRWREAIEYVAARREPGEIVVSLPAAVTEFYLTGGLETDVRSDDFVVPLDKFHPDSYAPWADDGRPMWIVLRTDYLNRFSAEDRGRLRRFLSQECRLARSFPVFVEARDLSIEVWRYR
ncbi:MAG: hypothetical protein AAF726_19535 [Planctomycetota bacterium]